MSNSLEKFTKFLVSLLAVLFLVFLFVFVFFGGKDFTSALRPSIYYALIVLGAPIFIKYLPPFLRHNKKRYQFMGLILFIYLLYVGATMLFLYFSKTFEIMRFIDILVAAELLALKYLALNMLISFSIAYLIYAFTVTYTPIVLNIISLFSSRMDLDEGNQRRGNLKYKIIGYLFDLPRFIDTDKLIISEKPSSDRIIQKSTFLLAIEIFLAGLLVLYIGLNPFIPPDLNRVILIDISLNIATLIPLLVLPVYLFHMLKPRIICGKSSYNVSRGLRKRVTGILITATTILLIMRLAFERTSGQTLLLAGLKLLIAIPGLMISTLIFIMIYEEVIIERTIAGFKRDNKSSDSFMDETEKKIKELIM